MRANTSRPSRRAFVSGAAALSAHIWIPRPVRGYTAAEMRAMSIEDVKPGVSKWELDTPALCVDLDKMEKNIQTMQAALTEERNSQPSARKDAQVRRHREAPAGHGVHRDLLREAERSGGDGRPGRGQDHDDDGESVEEQDPPRDGASEGAPRVHSGRGRGAERARSVRGGEGSRRGRRRRDRRRGRLTKRDPGGRRAAAGPGHRQAPQPQTAGDALV